MKIEMLVASTHGAAADKILRYNAALMAQASGVVQRLCREACREFRFAQAVGPHIRHVVDHYSAFISALERAPHIRIAYDVRERDLRMQSQPTVALARLAAVEARLLKFAADRGAVWDMDTPAQVVAQAGFAGEFELSTASTVGRELLFLSSHTVHHFALVAHYCTEAGVGLAHEFGKAPATVAFERLHATPACA